jgi:rubrerythrin
MLQLFRCRICGDPYLGVDKPTRCPFCGAPVQYLKTDEEWTPIEYPNLTPVSKANLEYTLKIEVSNATFYKCASQNVTDERWKAIFKALSKVEAEHADLVAKLLKVSVPGPEAEDQHCDSNLDVIKQKAHAREVRATEHYKKALAEATEARVQEVFEALQMIESEHIDLTEE